MYTGKFYFDLYMCILFREKYSLTLGAIIYFALDMYMFEALQLSLYQLLAMPIRFV